MKSVIGGLVALCCAANVAYATNYVVYNARVDWIVAESLSGTEPSSANFMQWTGGTGTYASGHPWCGQRAYILPGDKHIYATALAASVSGRTVSFIFEDAAEHVNLAGHNGDFACKVTSLWIP